MDATTSVEHHIVNKFKRTVYRIYYKKEKRFLIPEFSYDYINEGVIIKKLVWRSFDSEIQEPWQTENYKLACKIIKRGSEKENPWDNEIGHTYDPEDLQVVEVKITEEYTL